MDATMNQLQLRLTNHGFKRGAMRNIYPNWLHQSTAETFVLGKINQTVDKQVKQIGTLTKILLPDIKFYVRDQQDIVTMVRRKKKISL